MAFDWNFRRQPNLNNYIGSQVDPYNASRIATENMQGYTPNAAFTPGTPAQQAAAAMQGYNPNPQGGQFGVPNDMHGGMAQPDLEGYGESLQAAEQAAAQKQEREQTIQKLTSQIAELEQRITANKAKLKDWGGVESQIAAIEARKINGQDPTSVWRWKVDRDDARRIANAQNDGKNTAKANALIEANNILNSMIINDSLDTPTKNAMLSKLADVKTNLEKNGLPTKDVDKKIELLKGNGEQTPREQSTTDFETLLNNPNLSVELLDEFEASNPNLSRADWGKLDNKRAELTNKANKINLNKRYEAARKKAGIDKPTWDLLSKAKKKEILDNSGL